MRISDWSSDVCSSDLNQQFHPSLRIEAADCTCVPSFKLHQLVRAIMQDRARDSRPSGIGRKGDTCKVERELRPVLRIELPQLDEDRAAPVRPGNVPGADRVADISTHRIIAMLVLEDSFEHDELLAPIVGMRGKMACGSIAEDRKSVV